MFRAIEWKDGVVRILDQTQLPGEVVYVDCNKVEAVAAAIRGLLIRGAPAIGIAAAYGIALAAQNSTATSVPEFQQEIHRTAELLEGTRPTAVNLFTAIHRMKRAMRVGQKKPISLQKRGLLKEAHAILDEDIDANRTLGRLGAALIEFGTGILTYCNTGALATGGYGTALGIIRTAWEEGKNISVFVCETRPVLQGARLTAWELQQYQIPAMLITDSMAGVMMRLGKVQRCVVGADRIAANGDVANKVGTYTIAVLAKEHKIPFYVAAPTSTIDLATATGDQIPIEQRNPDEVAQIGGKRFAPEGITILNPAFDVTPAAYISAIITEKGIVPPQEVKRLIH
jgi:methylthioribose-1-phosphate isomerase